MQELEKLQQDKKMITQQYVRKNIITSKIIIN